MEIRSLSKHFDILSVLSVAGRNLIFCFSFQNLGHQHGKSAFLLQISLFWWTSIFLLSFRNAQNTQNVNEKAWILMENPWKFKSNAVLSLKCRGMLTILSNICNKGFSKIVNGV